MMKARRQKQQAFACARIDFKNHLVTPPGWHTPPSRGPREVALRGAAAAGFIAW